MSTVTSPMIVLPVQKFSALAFDIIKIIKIDNLIQV